MSFWHSDLGEITGKAEDAYTQSFNNEVIPNDTMAIAEIIKFVPKEYDGKEYYQIDWKITEGEYKGRIVFHKIHAFDSEPKKRHTALNMMKLIYKMFHVKPKDDTSPIDSDLNIFKGKQAGIKIQEWESKRNGKSGNWVSEVHPVAGFVAAIGTKMAHSTTYNSSTVDSALTRHAAKKSNMVDDDIPF